MTANEHQVGGKHYKTQYEHWDLVVKIPMGYLEGCATKYVSRWRKKDKMQDLKKATHYLNKLLEVANYETPRKLSHTEIGKEIDQFEQANDLSILEGEFIEILCTYRSSVDLIEARYVLEEIIENAETELIRYIDEPNYPGTPADGGHHAKQPLE